MRRLQKVCSTARQHFFAAACQDGELKEVVAVLSDRHLQAVPWGGMPL
jgi:hypothetical protein